MTIFLHIRNKSESGSQYRELTSRKLRTVRLLETEKENDVLLLEGGQHNYLANNDEQDYSLIALVIAFIVSDEIVVIL